MRTFLQDLRYGARSLGRRTGFTLIAVLTLAAGIGANTAIFSVVNATLIRTLPFKDPDRLMKVSLTVPRGHMSANTDMVWSYPKYQTFSSLQPVFEQSALLRGRQYNLTGADQAERLLGEQVQATYFPLLGVQPVLGRAFVAEEDATPETHKVVVVGYGFWERQFGRDPRALGRTITLNNENYLVVGILPPGFKGLTGVAEFWVPSMATDGRELKQRWSHSWEVLARLKPGVSADQAKSAVRVLGAQIDEAHPLPIGKEKWGARAALLDEVRLDGSMRRSFLVLFGAVGFVLLIACANIANLLLARASGRQREIAIRQAVGASRFRLVRQLLTESVLLSLLGAAAGSALAWWGVRLLLAIDPAESSAFGHRLSGLTRLGLGSVRVDGEALLFTFALALLTAMLFGLAPALACSRATVVEALKGGSHAEGVAGLRALRVKGLLVTAQIALAVMLLTGAGLMIKSFGRLLAVSSGADPDNVLTVRLTPPRPGVPARTLLAELERRVSALPGVATAGLGSCHPFAAGCSSTIIWFRDRPEVPPGTEPPVGTHFVSPDYFRTMKIPLLAGRGFTEADRQGAPKVVVVSETAARNFWPGESPIGKPVAVGQGGFQDRAEVIGVVGDVRYGQVGEPPRADVYISHLQSARDSSILFVRVQGEPSAWIAGVRDEVRALDRNTTVYDTKSLRDRMAGATAKARFNTILLGVFAGLALVLAAIGIYGVSAYAVAQRTREIGIRVALGARSGDVLALVMRRGFVQTFCGVALGVGGALAATRVLKSLLFGVTPQDPATYVVMALLLSSVAMLATWLPARRATRISAVEALRLE